MAFLEAFESGSPLTEYRVYLSEIYHRQKCTGYNGLKIYWTYIIWINSPSTMYLVYPYGTLDWIGNFSGNLSFYPLKDALYISEIQWENFEYFPNGTTLKKINHIQDN